MTFARAEEPLPPGRLSVSHYCAIHHHLFQDIYDWAGRFRTVRLTKGASTFCYPENIKREIRQLFAWFRKHRHLRGLSAGDFSKGAAHLEPDPMLGAMIRSFKGDEAPLAAIIDGLQP